MSCHYRISFSQIVDDLASFTTEKLINIAKKTKAVLKHRVVDDLRLYRQLNEYQGTPVTSFWEKSFGSAVPATSVASAATTKGNTSFKEGIFASKETIDELTPQQVLVFNKIRDMAVNTGYEIKALSSPSDDLIIDLYGFDACEAFKRVKVFSKRR